MNRKMMKTGALETEIMGTCETCGQERPVSLVGGKVATTCTRCRFPRLWEVLDKPMNTATRAFDLSFALAVKGRR